MTDLLQEKPRSSRRRLRYCQLLEVPPQVDQDRQLVEQRLRHVSSELHGESTEGRASKDLKSIRQSRPIFASIFSPVNSCPSLCTFLTLFHSLSLCFPYLATFVKSVHLVCSPVLHPSPFKIFFPTQPIVHHQRSTFSDTIVPVGALWTQQVRYNHVALSQTVWTIMVLQSVANKTPRQRSCPKHVCLTSTHWHLINYILGQFKHISSRLFFEITNINENQQKEQILF